MRDAFFKFDQDKEELLKGYEHQIEECKKQFDEDEQIKS